MANYDSQLLSKFRPRGNVLESCARELRERIDQQHAIRMGEILGCTVTIIRREPVKGKSGMFLFSEPVYGMPAEFIEAAQALGVLAEAK